MNFLNRIFKHNQKVDNLSDDDKNVLIASILFECAKVDGKSSTDEMDRVKFILKNKFNLKEEVLSKNFDEALNNTKNSVEIYDDIQYSIPFGIIGRILHYFWIRKELENIFKYREKVIYKIFSN